MGFPLSSLVFVSSVFLRHQLLADGGVSGDFIY